MDDAPDSAHIRRSLEDSEAFGVLFDRYSAMLYRYVARRLGPEPAEDLVGEAFLTAFRLRHRYDLTYPDARPWLFGIVTKLISRHRRGEAARFRSLARTPAGEFVESHADRVVARVTASDTGRRLAEALADLSRKDRDVLLLIAWGDLKYDEVGRALGIPVGTVRSRLHRTRRRLREVIGHNPLTNEPEGDVAWTS